MHGPVNVKEKIKIDTKFINTEKLYVPMVFSNPLRMINIDRNVSQLWHVACKKCDFNNEVFIGLNAWLVH
jgi:hypothetical protein